MSDIKLEKSPSSVAMERNILAAVVHMGCESLSPCDFDDLTAIVEQLAKTRHLGDAQIATCEPV
jgi:hypothetical protein